MSEQEAKILNRHQAYIDGKMQRYRLLFAVNGGAFAIASLIHRGREDEPIVGNLTLDGLAIGAVLFTILMWLDIWAFGYMMRGQFKDQTLFQPLGRTILTALASLVVIGWVLAANNLLVIPFVLIGTVAAVIKAMLIWKKDCTNQ